MATNLFSEPRPEPSYRPRVSFEYDCNRSVLTGQGWICLPEPWMSAALTRVEIDPTKVSSSGDYAKTLDEYAEVQLVDKEDSKYFVALFEGEFEVNP